MCQSPSITEVRLSRNPSWIETWRQGLEQRPWKNFVFMASCSLFNLFSFTTWYYLLRDDIAYSSILNNQLRECPPDLPTGQSYERLFLLRWHLLMKNLSSTMNFPSRNDLFISMPCVGTEKLVVWTFSKEKQSFSFSIWIMAHLKSCYFT